MFTLLVAVLAAAVAALITYHSVAATRLPEICGQAPGRRPANVQSRSREGVPPRAPGVRHPPRSGWLGERGRLKGGCPISLGVALNARLGG
jgi:hypothetical protein